MTTPKARQAHSALSAIDEGFRWQRKIKEEGEARAADFTRGGIHTLGYAVTMFQGAHKNREAWQPALHKKRWLHLTPTGIYFDFHPNSNSRFHAGSFLRPDGTVGGFRGSHYAPLYCLGCGRAGVRLALGGVPPRVAAAAAAALEVTGRRAAWGVGWGECPATAPGPVSALRAGIPNETGLARAAGR